ncbi:MAG: TIGR04141 family sporadically distributed protein [Treponema sp.]|nr:TIGR04141 family sporadically distributed protein [Treponema sp.]
MGSRSFSIYLLKPQYTADDSLKDEHPSGKPVPASNLPPGSKLYLLDSAFYSPWRKAYRGIKQESKQSLKGAMAFVPVNSRFFALRLGHANHYLKEYSHEYDFGLRITSNSPDPGKLKSADILNPQTAQRQRIQSPIGLNIIFFNFDRDGSIINRVIPLHGPVIFEKPDEKLADAFKKKQKDLLCGRRLGQKTRYGKKPD